VPDVGRRLELYPQARVLFAQKQGVCLESFRQLSASPVRSPGDYAKPPKRAKCATGGGAFRARLCTKIWIPFHFLRLRSAAEGCLPWLTPWTIHRSGITPGAQTKFSRRRWM
jgi:hypothetical protein